MAEQNGCQVGEAAYIFNLTLDMNLFNWGFKLKPRRFLHYLDIFSMYTLTEIIQNSSEITKIWRWVSSNTKQSGARNREWGIGGRGVGT